MKCLIKIYGIALSVVCFSSCKKFVEVPPPVTQLVGTSVYSSNSTASAAVTGIYRTMAANAVGGNRYGISALLGLSADEFILYPNPDVILNQTYTNSLSSINFPSVWSELYNCIYQANAALEGLSTSSGVTAAMKDQLKGEAAFIRSFCHFYLVNIFGDVPIVTSTSYHLNQVISRSPREQVFQQIVADLKNAQSLLNDDYLSPDLAVTTERVRPNKKTATALLARVYLYQQQWDSAEAEASAVINDAKYQLAGNVNDVFLANNVEAIWQLETPNNGFNTLDGAIFLSSFIYFGGPTAFGPFILSDTLAKSFEAGDARQLNWVGSAIVDTITYYYPYKYKLTYTGTPPSEYPVLFRLAEQYLIRAEARAQQNNLNGAADDVNMIRSRAGIPNTSASSQGDLLNAIYQERRLELFTEYGHRWLDLKRTGLINTIMEEAAPKKGGVWDPTDQLYPIPISDIKSNNHLTQNPGYN